MTGSSFIHFDCFCGADLYFLDCRVGKEYVAEAKNALKRLIQHPRFAIFTSQDGDDAHCPHCGCEVELPDPTILALLLRRGRKNIEWEDMSSVNSEIKADWLPSV